MNNRLFQTRWRDPVALDHPALFRADTDFSRISPLLAGKLYQSGTVLDWRAVLARGINTVVSLEYTLPRVDLLPIGFQHRQWVIDDGPLPDCAVLEELVEEVVRAVQRDRVVLVHCFLGLNRSSLVTARVLIRLGVCTPATVTGFLRTRRHAQALSNGHFRAYVEGG